MSEELKIGGRRESQQKSEEWCFALLEEININRAKHPVGKLSCFEF